MGTDFLPRISAYQTLESKGIDLISNPILKEQILEVYNLDYPKITLHTENKLKNISEYGRPIFRTKLRRIRGEEVISVPIDIDALMEGRIRG